MWIVWIVIASTINAARGGRYAIVNALPGHTRLYASLAFACLALIVLRDPMQAVTWGGCYLFWAWLPWGRWYDLNHSDVLPDRKPSWFETGIEAVTDAISPGNDSLAFAIRNAVALLPAAILLSPLLILLVGFQHCSYALGWWLRPRAPISAAEYLTGCAWGVALVLI